MTGVQTCALPIFEQLYHYYADNLDLLPEEYLYMINELKEPDYRVVCDYVAGMSDRYAVQKYKEIVIPKAWNVF